MLQQIGVGGVMFHLHLIHDRIFRFIISRSRVVETYAIVRRTFERPPPKRSIVSRSIRIKLIIWKENGSYKRQRIVDLTRTLIDTRWGNRRNDQCKKRGAIVLKVKRVRNNVPLHALFLESRFLRAISLATVPPCNLLIRSPLSEKKRKVNGQL